MYLDSELENFETQFYLTAKDILANGVAIPNRTGTPAIMKTHMYLFLESVVENFPVIKGKKQWPKLAMKEMIWFLYGKTDQKWLNDHGLHYWDKWMVDGTIGKSYGYQYRNFNGIDNTMNVLEGMIADPYGRRHLINIWNPSDLPEMNLPPCVYSYDFDVLPAYESEDKKPVYYVDCTISARSQDMFLGVPYDLMLAGWMETIVCLYLCFAESNKTGATYIPRNVHYTGSNCHIYVNHLKQFQEYFRNVEENRNGIIDEKAHLSTNYDIIDDHIAKNGRFKNIDELLDLIMKHEVMKDPADKFFLVMYSSPETNKDLYGTIEAEVAV